MKKWTALITGILCVLSSSLTADELAHTATIVAAEEQEAPAQVGKASADATNAAKSNNTAKYVLAASAVAIGVTAIILVSRHHGHHHHHSHH